MNMCVSNVGLHVHVHTHVCSVVRVESQLHVSELLFFLLKDNAVLHTQTHTTTHALTHAHTHTQAHCCNCLFKDNNKGRLSEELLCTAAAANCSTVCARVCVCVCGCARACKLEAGK